MEGQLAKMKLIGYENSKFDSPTGDEYEVLFNPDEFVSNYELEFDEGESSGGSGARLKFKGIKPGTFNLNLLFDSTGIIPETRGESVEEQIERFKSVALYFKGKTHAPPFVKLIWGKLIFKGALQSFKVTYNLFQQDGTPIRAKAVAAFKETVDDKLREARENKSSPDMTHVIQVLEGDTLPNLSQRIYGTPRYYLELARVNELDNFRNLVAGTRLIFPPIDK